MRLLRFDMTRRTDKRSVFHIAQASHQAPVSGACARGFLNQPESAEQLVGLGFRHWLKGCQTADVTHWERAWTLYSSRLGCNRAKVVMGELSSWVRLLSCRARRDLEVAPHDCVRFCRDECLAVSMIAASQHKTCPAMRACAFAMIEDSMIEEVVDQTDQFALTLRASDQLLSPSSILAGDLSSVTPLSPRLQ